MSKPEKFTGDDWTFTINLATSAGAYDASGADVIEVAVVSANNSSAELLIPAVSADPMAPGADWANGVVAVTFPESSTDIATYGTLWLELQITSGSAKTTFPRANFRAQRGLVP